jgi:hypothetical protein
VMYLPMVLAACGGGSGSGSGSGEGGGKDDPAKPPAVSAIPALDSANDKPLPLDAYLLNPEQDRTLSRAEQALVSRCMARFGFTYAAGDGTPERRGGDMPASRIDGRYGPQSMALARQWGYHPEGGAVNAAPQPWAKTQPKLTPQMRTAMTGSDSRKEKLGPGGQTLGGHRVPVHGCAGEARKELTGSPDKPAGNARLAGGLNEKTLAQMMADPRVRAVYAKWSACMAGKGYHYAVPAAAQSDDAWARTDRPSPREIRVAVADQQCRKKHNVVGVSYAVDFAYQKRAIEDNAEAMAAAKTAIDKQLKAAARALAG